MATCEVTRERQAAARRRQRISRLVRSEQPMLPGLGQRIINLAFLAPRVESAPSPKPVLEVEPWWNR